MDWRNPEIEDQGREFLIQSEQLVEPDWCPNGVAIGTVLFLGTDEAAEAYCAVWCGSCDNYHNQTVAMPFKVHDLPPPSNLDCQYSKGAH